MITKKLNSKTCPKGWKRYLVRDEIFEVPENYELEQCVGQGAFGIVCSAKVQHPVTGDQYRVAIKKVPVRGDNILELKRLVREVFLLRHFDHENIISLRDLIGPSSDNHFNEIYIVSELMDTDLQHVIRSSQPLSEDHILFFMYQLLRGLKAIHDADVLHRDLKPSNIVVDSNCDLKICDFGLARERDFNNPMTDYVATRWYRAPELLMQWQGYSGAVDVWSVGCIFAELFLRTPLFAGRNNLDQLNIILKIVGTPDEEAMEGIGHEKARAYVQRNPRCPRTDFQTLFPMASPKAVDLLEKMLEFNPRQRISVPDSQTHPVFAHLHVNDTEKSITKPFIFESAINDPNVTVYDLKHMLFQQLVSFHSEYQILRWWEEEKIPPTKVTKSTATYSPITVELIMKT